ncbi:GAF domain-containing protein [Aquincola sp. MAHUQ-54]|uniref:histidine kinase n=1 Tax=Aquincola agrisoli TaxID=3119538 RepID=A0AAW9Q1X2_9BURK
MQAVPPAPRSTTLALLDGERRVLAQIAAGVPLQDVLDALLRSLEACLPGSARACALLLERDERLHVGAAPLLPHAFLATLEGLPADGSHALGAALASAAPAVVSDIADDPLWAGLRPQALGAGLQRWWGAPVRAAGGARLGLLNCFFTERHEGTLAEFDTLALAAQTMALAIERQGADRRLREAEARHRQILDSATDYAIIALDPEGRVTRWNEGAHRMLGWREEEMLGQTLHRCFTPPDLVCGRIEREMAAARAGHPSPDEGWRVRSDGSRIWASGEMTQLRGDGGEALGFVKVLRDRTRQRRADLRQSFLFELSESLHGIDGAPQITDAIAARLGALLEVSRVGFGHVDGQSRVHIEHDWTDGSVDSAPGIYQLDDYGSGLAQVLHEGVPLVVDDVTADPRTASGASRYARLQIGALLLVPLAPVTTQAEGGGLVFVCSAEPRRWVEDDIVLLREVGERLRLASERARAREALRLSEERLHIAQRAGSIGSFELFPDEREVAVSSSFCALWGLPEQPRVHVSQLVELVDPEDHYLLAVDPQPSGQRLGYVEYRIRRADDGSQRWLARRGEALDDTGSGRRRYLGVCYDITARKQAEARQALLLGLADRLRPSGEPLSLLTDALQMLRDFLGVHRAGLSRVRGELVTVEAEQTDGRPAEHRSWPLAEFGETALGHWQEGRTTVCSDIAEDGAQPVLERFGVHSLVAVPLRGDGTLRALLYAAQHEPRIWTPAEVALIEDVAARIWDAVERARAEQALRDESRALETLNRTAALLAGNFDLDTLVQQVVDAGTALTGARFGAFFYATRSDDGERLMLYALSGADRADFERFGMPRATAVFAPTFRGEGILRSPDITQDPRYGHNPPLAGMPEGHLPVRSYMAVPVVARSGDVLGCLLFGHPEPGIFAERAERLCAGLAAQAAIAIDNARLFQATQRDNETLEARVEERTRERDQVWALTEDLLAIADPQGHLQRVSASWTRQLGHPHARLLLQPLAALIHPDDAQALHEALARMRADGQPVRIDNRIGTAAGDWRVIAWTLSQEPGTGRFVAAGRDVTAERERQSQLQEAQEALRQSQKMEVVGQLTGGIAHDFNNLLQGITGSLDLIKRRVQQGRTGELDRFVAGAMASAQRAAALTHRLLAFARRQPLDPRPVEANPLVASMEDLLRRTLGESVTLELALSQGLWLTLCDPNQLESAILNLCINARDAMPGGGRLTVETVNTSLDASYAARIRDIEPGQYVCISVTDSGTGMPPDVAARAFEPFFTTKPIGQGTGLGLSMIYGFARQSEGHVKLYSEVGRGTTVKLYLPRWHGDAVPADEPAPSADDPRSVSGRVVLVVEDEAVVRALVVDVLQELGYSVLEAADGNAGLAVLLGTQPIDLLITDVGLPGLNGRQMADAAREHRPGLKVLFMTGYAETAAVANGFLEPGMHMITKPFSMEAMAARLRETFGLATQPR